MNFTPTYSPDGVVCALRWNGPEAPAVLAPAPISLPTSWHIEGEYLLHAQETADGWAATTYRMLAGPAPINRYVPRAELPPCAREAGPYAYDTTAGRTPLGHYPSESEAVEAARVMLAHQADPVKLCRWSDVQAVRRDRRNGLFGQPVTP